MADNAIAPVIDLEAADAVQQLDDACTRVGFFQCRGHGMPQDVLDNMLEAAFEFFRLPLDQKMKASSNDPAIERGFTAPGSEGFSYSMGVETPPDLVVEVKEGVSPSPARLAKLASMIRKENVRVILHQPFEPEEASQLLARRTGAVVVKLAPSVGSLPQAPHYVALFDYNVGALGRTLSGAPN